MARAGLVPCPVALSKPSRAGGLTVSLHLTTRVTNLLKEPRRKPRSSPSASTALFLFLVALNSNHPEQVSFLLSHCRVSRSQVAVMPSHRSRSVRLSVSMTSVEELLRSHM